MTHEQLHMLFTIVLTQCFFQDSFQAFIKFLTTAGRQEAWSFVRLYFKFKIDFFPS